MDHYPEVSVSERECKSRRRSTSSSPSKTYTHRSLNNNTQNENLAPPQYTSFPPPSNISEQQNCSRNDSVHSRAIHNNDVKLHGIEAECAQYMDAPPPYSEKQYEGKSEDEQTKMRMADYAKELKRMMGKQLVRGLKTGQPKSQM